MKRFVILATIGSALICGFHSVALAQDVSRADTDALVKGNTQFALDLYSRLREREGNVILSPYSISNALAMTYAGARGETAQEMAKVLHFDLAADRLHAAFGDVIGQLQEESKDRPYQLYVANSLWGQRGSPWRSEFLKLTQKNYLAGLKEVDFKSAPDEGRIAINDWVEKRTNGKIKNLLNSGDVTEKTRFVLTNAIYFKATWKTQFPKHRTSKADFALTPTKKTSVPMMHIQEGKFKYFEAKDSQWLELPYKGNRLSMVIILPAKDQKLPELEKKMTASAIQKRIKELYMIPGSIALPRFKVMLRFSLSEDLEKMGMVSAFSSNADFSGIGSAKDLRLGRIIHKAWIEVDEEGTEAAAATTVETKALSRPMTFSFRADRPFMFFIRDIRTGSILFLGRLTDPGSKAAISGTL